MPSWTRLLTATTFANVHALRGPFVLFARPVCKMSAWTSALAEVDSPVSSEIVTNLAGVQSRVATASAGREVTLVAVSKTKPLSVVAAAASAGHRDFGENYVQELVEKATAAAKDGEAMAQGIRWHFIGRLQSNKAKLLCSTPNLHAVHTVHNEKCVFPAGAATSTARRIAGALQRHWLDLHGPDAPPLNVFIQVNTSGEESKGGCEPAEAADLVRWILPT